MAACSRGRRSHPVPYLVVGLARSGVAVALALRGRGAAVAGCDAGAVPAERRAELEAAGVAVHAGTHGLELLAAAGSVVKSPGVPAQAPVVAAAREARACRWSASSRSAGGSCRTRSIAVTGSNGKTTTVGADRPPAPRRGPGRGGGGERRDGALHARRRGCRRPRRSSARRPRSSSRTPSASRPTPRVLLNLAEDHLDRHGTFDAYRAAKLQVFARQPPGTVGGRAGGARGTRAAGGGARRVLVRDRPGRPARRPRGRAVVGRGAPDRLRGDPAARAAQPPQRDGRGGGRRSPAGMAPDAVARGARDASPASRTGWRRSRRATACSTSTTRRPRTSPRRSPGSSSFAGGVHVILGGRGKGGDYAPLAAPVAERARAVYLIGETAPEIGAALALGRRAAARERRPRGRAGRRARRGAAGRGGAALAGVRLASTSTPTTRPAASISGRSWRALTPQEAAGGVELAPDAQAPSSSSHSSTGCC